MPATPATPAAPATDITKATLYFVTDSVCLPMSFDRVVTLITSGDATGRKPNDYSIFANIEDARVEFERRSAANEVIVQIRRESHEFIRVIRRAVDLIAMRNPELIATIERL